MDWIPPMEPKSSDIVITGEEWIYQIKWDGIRGLSYFHTSTVSEQVRIFTKKGRERTAFYPELHQMKELITGNSAVLDGEIVVLDEENKPSFHLSLTRDRVANLARLPYYTRNYPAMYIVFDILYHNGHMLTSLPLHERKEIIHHTLKPYANIAIAEDYNDGPGLFEFMKKKGWEGIVSKKRTSPYLPGKNHKEWYKNKAFKKVLTAVCGIQWKDKAPNSLILGILQEGKWIFVGKAATGLSQNDWRQMAEYALKYKKGICPFQEISQWKGKPVTWISPVLTCWIRFLEWTHDGVLRHPVIIGFADSSINEANGREWSVDE